MALYVTELLNSVRTSEDFQKRGAMTRRFIVTTKDPKAAKQADGIPQARASHPDDPTYILNSKSTSPTGTGFTFVDCEYSNDRRGYPRNPNRDEATWYHWGWGYRDAEVVFYYNERVKLRFPNTTGEAEWVWELKRDILSESRALRPLFVRLEKVRDVRWLDPIRQQKNKIHEMPDGQKYRFIGGDVTQVDDYTFDVKYEWELDEGTRLPFGLNSPDGRIQIPFDLNLVGYLRRPYTRIYGMRSENPKTTPHGTFTMSEFQEDLAGWRTLPGANRVI